MACGVRRRARFFRSTLTVIYVFYVRRKFRYRPVVCNFYDPATARVVPEQYGGFQRIGGKSLGISSENHSIIYYIMYSFYFLLCFFKGIQTIWFLLRCFRHRRLNAISFVSTFLTTKYKDNLQMAGRRFKYYARGI